MAMAEPAPDDRLDELYDLLMRACEDYSADEAVRALASALVTIVADSTADAAEARQALDRLVSLWAASATEQ
jgi:secreted Zn-dependent insulinase-like peptidase